MQESADIELLRQYAERNSEAAFAELVTRYVNLVYSAAARKTGNLHAAEEITQAVFIILARKAKSIRKETILSGWLYQTARLTAANFLRHEIRRGRREQEAYMQSLSNETDAWPEIAPLLEDAMGRLNEKERNAIVLRFFEGRSFQEIGAAINGSENAAKKRVIRGLEKLRKFFTRRGVNSTTAIIGEGISAHSIQVAPAALARTVTALAVAKGASASASTLTLIQGALKLMAWTKAKTATVAGLTAILIFGGTAFVVEVCLPAPDIQGMWQTTVPLAGWGVKAGETPKTRRVLKIVRTNGEYQATGDSIDEGYKDVPIVFNYKYPRLHVEIPGTPDSFDGTINRWGTRISGKWKENNAFGPLVLTRTTKPPAFPEPLADEDFVSRADSDLQGFWKGNIGTGKAGLEVNIKIAEPSHGTFRADFYCPPQGGGRQPAAVSYDGAVVKLMPMTGYGMFEGQLRNGGKEMVGKWIQGGHQTLTTFALAN